MIRLRELLLRNWKVLSGTFVSIAIVFGFQNCGQPGLVRPASLGGFASSGFPLQMRAPTQYPVHKRYVILVDMSNSMVSGPCPFDVDAEPNVHGYSGIFHEWDPNPTKTDPEADINDGRAQARDCQVDPTLEPPLKSSMVHRVPANSSWNTVFRHKTFAGADPQANRFAVVEEWLKQLRENLPQAAQQRVQVLIWPINGGAAMKSMIKDYPLKNNFVYLFDPRIPQAMTYLKNVHTTEKRLRETEVVSRWFETLNLDTNMGTTSIGEVLSSIYTPLNSSFRELALAGEINSSNFEIMLFGDGHITPLNKQFDSVMNMWQGCSACQGSMCTGICSELYMQMKDVWGDPEANKIEAVDFRLSLLQALPRFYGGGFLDVNLLQLNPDKYDLVYPNSKSAFQSLIELSDQRQSKVKKWGIRSNKVPFNLATSANQITTFKMTHLFILNPNVRMGVDGAVKIDSDGDGLSDEDETIAGTDLAKLRTDGYCIDSMAAHPVYGAKCKALRETQGCNSTLDSDGDSLNECEELVIGSDPFDFDTDGDALPDSLEFLNGFNALRPDTEMDTNADGLVNLIHFGAGVPPQVNPNEVLRGNKVEYQVNQVESAIIDDSELGQVRVDQFDVRIQAVPGRILQKVSSENQGDLFISRVIENDANRDKAFIPFSHRLMKSTNLTNKNLIFGLLRTVDPDQPERVFWQILEVPFDLSIVNTAQQLDISRFEQIRVMDRHSGGQ